MFLLISFGPVEMEKYTRWNRLCARCLFCFLVPQTFFSFYNVYYSLYFLIYSDTLEQLDGKIFFFHIWMKFVGFESRIHLKFHAHAISNIFILTLYILYTFCLLHTIHVNLFFFVFSKIELLLTFRNIYYNIQIKTKNTFSLF